MAPRRSARVAAVVERATTVLPPLLHAVVLHIFAQLPADLRARCACVCRGWRAAVSERSLWMRLDVSRTSGISVAVTDALLRGAAARAGGALQTLDVSGSWRVSHEALLAVATANANALRELRVCHGVRLNVNVDPVIVSAVPLGHVEALLRAGPQLRVLEADVVCGSLVDVHCMLHPDEGLLSPLRVHGLRAGLFGAAEADFLALAADIASHAWLQELCVTARLRTQAALDAVVDGALARRLTAVSFAGCGLTPAAAPALARLLGGSAFSDLAVWGGATALLDAPAAALLADALRANSTLTALRLQSLRLWDDVAAAATLLGALTAHSSLRTLSLVGDAAINEADRAVAGAALGALLAANAPALTELNISFCGLGAAGMAPLLQALAANTRLRTLNCTANNMTEAFAAAVLLPAVRANTSLRELHADANTAGCVEAMQLVRDRA
jgi:hypothetical protein